MGPSIARNEFDRLMAHEGFPSTIEMLKAMVNSTPPTYETEYLDFKVGSINGKDTDEVFVTKNWSKAIAGFATSAGGVLVWGLDAREGKGSKIDQVLDYAPVLVPDKFKTRLKKLLIDATDPPVTGIEIEALPDPADGGKGAVICYIPESDYKPHRANQDSNRWRMRVGDNFVDVPPAILRSLFFPRRQSFLSMECKINHVTGVTLPSRDVERITFGFRVINDGPATASQLMVIEKPDHPTAGQGLGDFWAKSVIAGGYRYRYGAALHPGDNIALNFMEMNLKRPINQVPVVTTFKFTIFAEDLSPQRVTFNIGSDDWLGAKTIRQNAVPVELDRFS